MSYHPQPGTFPFRVIEYLRTLPAGSERSSAELGETLGQFASDVANLLQYPRGQGALKTRREGRLVFWSLGDGVPPPLPEDHDPDQPLRRAPVKPTEAPIVAISPVVAPKATPASPFRVGLWNDGAMEIWRGSELFLLSRAEVEQVRELLRGAP